MYELSDVSKELVLMWIDTYDCDGCPFNEASGAKTKCERDVNGKNFCQQLKEELVL